MGQLGDERTLEKADGVGQAGGAPEAGQTGAAGAEKAVGPDGPGIGEGDLRTPVLGQGDPVVVDAPVSGELIALGEVADPVFARGMLGEGVAIVPAHRATTILSPAAGTLTTLAPTGHGLVLSAEGVSVMVHAGIDTVELGGEGFRVLGVACGDEVAQGQPLVGYDVAAVAAAGLDPTVMVVLTETGGRPVTLAAPGPVSAGDPIAMIG